VAMAALTRTVRQAVQVLMLALGAWLVIRAEATPGVMIATTTLLGRALAPVELIVGSWRVLAEGRAAFARLGELLAQAAAEPKRMELPAPLGQLSANQLVFRPQGSERVILGGVSLHLEAGESLGIIGPSGAGKSTLVRLLTGVWKPTTGTVRLDAADLSSWPREQLGPWIGYVPQDVELFPGRVGHNIARLGKVDAAKVVVAAKQAHVHELILSLPDGYDTMIEPGSALLSPGQRQRIALARALYGDPRLLILDEPNSNLDGAGEVALGQTLKSLRGKVTVVVVTHRTTLVQHIDKLLVLEGGRAKHYGPAAEVMKAMNQQAVVKTGTGAQVVEMLIAARGVGDQHLQPHLDEARGLARWAVAVLLLGLVPVLAWMSLAPLASAVVAQAFVKVDLDRRPVQHAEGGLVREVRVRDGQRVAAGETLLVLGDVAVDADVNRLGYRVLSERASLARLESEQMSANRLVFSAELQSAARTDARLAEQMVKERSLFDARRDALHGQVGLLRSQRDRIAQEREALRAQVTQATESIRHQRAELETNRNLLKDGFISPTRISQLEATVADYGVKIEEKHSEIARAEQRLLDTDLRIKALEGDYRQQASDQLKVSAARLAEIQQEQRKSVDASSRQVIVAPVAGDVINLKFTSPGSVVSPREPIADIVPSNPRLVVEARIRTEDVTRVQQGQAAEIRFTAFNHRTTKLVDGKVFYVAADRSVDRNTNQAYYVALVEADAGSLAQAGEVKLQAGMPAEVFIKGEERTPLQYLIEPVTSVLRRAGRER
jgi:membrane fusion protein, epimerase transport system